MRIGVLGSGVRWDGARPPAYLAEAAAPHELVGTGLRAGLFPYTPADAVLVDAAHLDVGCRLLARQPDALYVDTFGEYALDALRSATGLPVVGAAEATLAAAASHGPRFAIVTVWPQSMAWLYRARLRRHGAEAACTGVTYVGTGNSVERLREDVAAGAATLIRAVVEACRAAAASGADSIVLGCTCMAPMYGTLAAAVSVPVLCASRTGLAAAIDAAHVGVPPSIADYPRADPALAVRVGAALDGIAALAAGAAVAGEAGASAGAGGADADADAGAGAGAGADEGCPVCVGPWPEA